jgi:hypothetical protein
MPDVSQAYADALHGIALITGATSTSYSENDFVLAFRENRGGWTVHYLHRCAHSPPAGWVDTELVWIKKGEKELSILYCSYHFFWSSPSREVVGYQWICG